MTLPPPDSASTIQTEPKQSTKVKETQCTDLKTKNRKYNDKNIFKKFQT